MGHRLSRIYTRTGDKGTTGLGDGSRVDKDNSRVEAFGAVDELNSLIGLLSAHDIDSAIREQLTGIQHVLFDLGGELCIPGRTVIGQQHVDQLETFLDDLNDDLQPLKEFILPGGSQAASVCHVARTICRRTERRVITLGKTEHVNEHSLKYLNRLSDLLFVVARSLNKTAGVSDVLWQPHQND